jgi:hypothetical protein
MVEATAAACVATLKRQVLLTALQDRDSFYHRAGRLKFFGVHVRLDNIRAFKAYGPLIINRLGPPPRAEGKALLSYDAVLPRAPRLGRRWIPSSTSLRKTTPISNRAASGWQWTGTSPRRGCFPKGPPWPSDRGSC